MSCICQRYPCSRLRLGADVGGCAACDAHQLVERSWEDPVRVAASGADLVVLRERDVDDGAQRLRVVNRCDAVCGFCT